MQEIRILGYYFNRQRHIIMSVFIDLCIGFFLVWSFFDFENQKVQKDDISLIFGMLTFVVFLVNFVRFMKVCRNYELFNKTGFTCLWLRAVIIIGFLIKVFIFNKHSTTDSFSKNLASLKVWFNLLILIVYSLQTELYFRAMTDQEVSRTIYNGKKTINYR